ncbi:MAG: adenylate kinase [Clostridiaceae bacterium]
MNLILLGPPGAGKGTQAKMISGEFDIPHISTGDIFRKNISEKTLLGIEAKKYIDNGLLVPDELTVRIIEDRLKLDDAKNGYLLDGFPRTVNQAQALSKIDKINNVILIKVPDEYILERITGRRVCMNCGASFHMKFNPPKKDGLCDFCNEKLVQRKDDTEETVKERLKVYKNQTEPLAKYYSDKNILGEVDGTSSIDAVFVNICKILRGEYK